MSVAIVQADSYDDKIIENSLNKGFRLLGYDDQNPLGHIVKPGDRVFIKPNWVAHRYRQSCPSQHSVYTTITHPSVIKAVVENVARSLKGRGEIIIGDNPSIDADFEELMNLCEIKYLESKYDVPVKFLDLRPLVCSDLSDYGIKARMKAQEGDPEGVTVVNLGKESLLYGLNSRLFRGVFSDDRRETVKAHTGNTQLYGISNSIFKSDVYISIPKLKAHHKVGTTLNLKGLVGTMGIKNYLVHWRVGFPLIGGDEYPSFYDWLRSKFEKVTNRGAWDGNDTIWRMVVDLYTVIQRGPKKFFSVIDGVMGGDQNGPFCPLPQNSKCLLLSDNLLEADLVASRFMGYDVESITYLYYYLKNGLMNKDNIKISSVDFNMNNFWDNKNGHLEFKTPTNWPQLAKWKEI